MATLANVLPPAARAVSPGLTPLLARLAAWRARGRVQRQVIRELSAHTDRQLADMGFTRDDIRAIARGSYQR